MELSKKAKDELRKVIINSISPETSSKLNDHDLNEIGLFLLTALAEGLKLKVKEEKIKTFKQ